MVPSNACTGSLVLHMMLVTPSGKSEQMVQLVSDVEDAKGVVQAIAQNYKADFVCYVIARIEDRGTWDATVGQFK